MLIWRVPAQTLILCLLAATDLARAAPTTIIDAEILLWPADILPPGEDKEIGPERTVPKRPGEREVIRLTDIGRPAIQWFPAPVQRNRRTTVLVAPGGGYHILAWDLEGTEVAQWLNSIGVNAFVLKYRCPRRPGTPGDQPPLGPLQDAQRALRLIRSRAAEYGVDPKRLGMLGFSAGGHLTAATATEYETKTYDPIDTADSLSCRPDFGILVYPGYLATKDNQGLRPEIKVNSKTPPCFFAHATNDPVAPENSIHMFLALKRANVPAELHIYSTGGHGFGLRPSADPCCNWPNRCEEWMRAGKLIP